MLKAIQKIVLCVAIFGIGCAPAFAQTYGQLTSFAPQFFDNNGQPLSGGLIYTCAAGNSCPGTPIATFTTQTGFTQNANPIVLDVSGRPSNGPSPVGIWGPVTQQYKIVVETAAGVIISTTDNVSPTAPSSGAATTNYWTLGGTTISNNNAAGAGDVAIGGALIANNNVTIAGGLGLKSALGGVATIQASSTMAVPYTWKWPSVDAASAGMCLESDALGSLSFGACGGGGGGGSPGGPGGSVQFNNSGSLGGTANFLWNNSSQVATIIALNSGVPGLVVLTGYAQSETGFLAENVATPSTALNFNAIQVPTGGMYALSFTSLNYVNLGNYNDGTRVGIPPLTTSDSFNAGAIYWDCGGAACSAGTGGGKIFNGAAWIALASGGATSPGGASTNVQFNSGGAFGGSSNLVYASQVLSSIASSSSAAGMYVRTGIMQSDSGFLAQNAAAPSTALNFNAVQVPTGGMYAKSFTALNYINLGNYNDGTRVGVPPLTTADSFNAGAVYWDCGGGACSAGTGSGKIFNGTAWVTLATGGATSPGGANTNVQFNSSGSFGGSSNLIYAGQVLSSIASSSAAAGMYVRTGIMQADNGFLAQVAATPGTALNYNVIQAPTGGVSALSFTGVNYLQTGNFSTAIASGPPLTTSDSFHAGAISYHIPSLCLAVYSGTNWACISSGGGVTPGTPTTSVQFNNGGSFGGSANFEWINGSQLLNITAVSSSVGLHVINGYTQSDIGFLATGASATAYNAVQAPGGGVAGLSFTAVNYVQTGNHSGIPTATSGDSFHAGATFWDTSIGAQRVFNGSSWISLATGGVSSINGLTGTPSVTCIATTSCSISAFGSSIQISSPQPLATSSNVQFNSIGVNSGPPGVAGAITASSTIQSTGTGATIVWQGGFGTSQINGTGQISGLEVNTSNGYKVGGTVVIDSGRNITGAANITGSGALNITGGAIIGGGIQASNYNTVGGGIGQTWNIGFGSTFTINGSGAFSTLIFKSGVLISAF